jgi:hypothetical protein
MTWTFDDILNDELIEISSRDDKRGQFRIRLGSLRPKITFRIEIAAETRYVGCHQSHLLLTPLDTGPSGVASNSAAYRRRADQRARRERHAGHSRKPSGFPHRISAPAGANVVAFATAGLQRGVLWPRKKLYSRPSFSDWL